MKIIAALAKVMAEVGVIAKTKKAGADLKYAYRGVDDVVAAIQPLLAAHGVVMLSRVVAQSRDAYTNKNGTQMVNVRLTIEHDFFCAEDASKVTACTVGEAMDTSDKASNKAMTAAEKYALTQTFKIPTYEVDRDLEEQNHQYPGPPEMGPPPSPPKTHAARPPATVHQFPTKAPSPWEVRINEAQTLAALTAVGMALAKEGDKKTQEEVRQLYTRRHTELAAKEKTR